MKTKWKRWSRRPSWSSLWCLQDLPGVLRNHKWSLIAGSTCPWAGNLPDRSRASSPYRSRSAVILLLIFQFGNKSPSLCPARFGTSHHRLCICAVEGIPRLSWGFRWWMTHLEALICPSRGIEPMVACHSDRNRSCKRMTRSQGWCLSRICAPRPMACNLSHLLRLRRVWLRKSKIAHYLTNLRLPSKVLCRHHQNRDIKWYARHLSISCIYLSRFHWQ